MGAPYLEYSHWSDYEDRRLMRRLKSGSTRAQIKETFSGRTRKAINERIRILRLAGPKPKLGAAWTEENELQLTTLLANGFLQSEAAKILGRTKASIKQRAYLIRRREKANEPKAK